MNHIGKDWDFIVNKYFIMIMGLWVSCALLIFIYKYRHVIQETTITETTISSSQSIASTKKTATTTKKEEKKTKTTTNAEATEAETAPPETTTAAVTEPPSTEVYTTEDLQTTQMSVATEADTYEPEYSAAYSENDIVLLAMLINHEASASWEGKVYVGSVVVNRMNYFGESVANVIYMPGQFTYDLSYYTDEDYQAAKYVLENGSVDSRLFYFTGCHPDGLNWFCDIDNNFIIAR